MEKEWLRPDGKLGKYRGNAQSLPNGNMLVHWGDNGYITEFDGKGKVLQEAHLLPTQLGTYRAYKLELSGTPSEPIVMKCFAHDVFVGDKSTVCHITWNGATNFKFWELHNSTKQTSTALVRTPRTGFETMVVAPGLHDRVYARAMSVEGTTLGTSEAFNFREVGADAESLPLLPEQDVARPSEVLWSTKQNTQQGPLYFITGLAVGAVLMNLSTRYFTKRHARRRSKSAL
jgi:hypothetical protein